MNNPIGIFAATIALAVPSVALAEDYYLTGWASNNGLVSFVDAETIKSLPGGKFTGWVTTVYSLASFKKDSVRYDKALKQVDCAAERIVVKARVEYGATGDVVSNKEAPSYEMGSLAVPGSVGKAELDFMCHFPESKVENQHVTSPTPIEVIGYGLLNPKPVGSAK